MLGHGFVLGRSFPIPGLLGRRKLDEHDSGIRRNTLQNLCRIRDAQELSPKLFSKSMSGWMSSKVVESVHLQNAHGLDPGGPSGGEVHRHGRYQDQHQRNGSERDRVDGPDVIELIDNNIEILSESSASFYILKYVAQLT